MSNKPDNRNQVWAGGVFDGTAATVVAGTTPNGIASIARTGGGDAAGDYTITLKAGYDIPQDSASMHVTSRTHLAATPFTCSVTQLTSKTFRVRTVSNGVAANCNFSFDVKPCQPVVSIP